MIVNPVVPVFRTLGGKADIADVIRLPRHIAWRDLVTWLPSCYDTLAIASIIRSYEEVREGRQRKRARDMLIKHNLKDRDSKLTFKANAQASLAV